jgi:hypothetical protein
VYVAPTTKPTAHTGPIVSQEWRVDLDANAPDIVIDRTGDYTWTSRVVLRVPPATTSGSYHVNGDAQIEDFEPRLVSVAGGTSMRVTFTVVRFSGRPTVKLSLEAQQQSGVVTGFINPCVGIRPRGMQFPYAEGTVIALRGVTRLEPIPGGHKEILPTARVGRQHVDNDTPYRFELPPGRYVMAWNYGRDLVPKVGMNVTIQPGKTVRLNLGACK